MVCPLMPRTTPCRACQKRQKGCFWINNYDACARCTRRQLECVPVDENAPNNDDVMPSEFNTQALEYWQYQASQLENELRHVERNIQRYHDDTGKKPQLQQKQMNWKLSIENGLLKLHSTISSFEELSMYSRASLRYLSPFECLFTKTPIRFENSIFITVVLRVFRYMFSRAISDRPYHNYLPPSIPDGIHEIMDELVLLYIQYKNPTFPVLHAPTYLVHYYNLKDPLSCPVTLAICVDAICNTHFLKKYSSTERHNFAEFFYARCRSILLDMYDDPDKKLETVITISLLQEYILFVLLQPSEARRLATIGYLICKDLETSLSSHHETTVSRVLCQRHLLHSESMLNLLHFMCGETVFKPVPTISYLEKLPDEDENTSQYIDLHNHFIQLSANLYIKAMTSFSNMGDNELSLETIFRLDEAIRKWWSNIPSHLRFCDDIYAEGVADALEHNTSVPKAAMFALAHSSMLRVYACMINPESDSVGTWSTNKEMLAVLSEKAISIVLRSCNLLLSAVLRILSSQECLPSSMTFEFISRAMHAMLNVSSCPNVQIPSSLQHKLYQSFNAVQALYPSDNQIPPSSSPLNMLVTTRQPTDFGVYQNFPFPGYALFADMLSTSCMQLQSHFVNGSATPVSSLNSFIASVLGGDFSL